MKHSTKEKLKAFKGKLKSYGLECSPVPAFSYTNPRNGKLIEVDAHERCYKKKIKGPTVKVEKANPKSKEPEAKQDNSVSESMSEAIKANNGYPMSQTSDGKESILYNNILAEAGGDILLADKIKAQVYSDEFKEWFGDWQGGEIDKDAYPMAAEGTWYGEGDYKKRGGVIEYVTPDEFLANAKPLEIDETTLENVEDLKNHIKAGRDLDPLTLYRSDTSDVKASDGRHRALAAKDLGISHVPVVNYTGESIAKGASKVVDMNGEPLMYHHATRADFEKFGGGRAGLSFFAQTKDSAIRGMVAGEQEFKTISNQPKTAESRKGRHVRTMPTYLKSDRLYGAHLPPEVGNYITESNKLKTEAAAEAFAKKTYLHPDIIKSRSAAGSKMPHWLWDVYDKNIENHTGHKLRYKELTFNELPTIAWEHLEKDIATKRFKSMFNTVRVSDEGYKTIAVRNSNQIKSIFNDGSFSSTNNNIYGTKISKVIKGTKYAGKTIREIMQTEDGRKFLNENYF